MLARIGIGNVLDCTECGPDILFELSDEPFLEALLFPNSDDFKLGIVVLLHLDFSSIGGRRRPRCLSSDQTEREAMDPSRELLKSRKDVTPSESPLEDLEGGSTAEVGGMDKGVNRNRILEGPCKESGLCIGPVPLSEFGGSELPDKLPVGLLSEGVDI